MPATKTDVIWSVLLVGSSYKVHYQSEWTQSIAEESYNCRNRSTRGDMADVLACCLMKFEIALNLPATKTKVIGSVLLVGSSYKVHYQSEWTQSIAEASYNCRNCSTRGDMADVLACCLMKFEIALNLPATKADVIWSVLLVGSRYKVHYRSEWTQSIAEASYNGRNRSTRGELGDEVECCVIGIISKWFTNNKLVFDA